MGHDNMDYDGMGNHGRFPPQQPKPQKRRHNLTDLILILGCVGVVTIYLIIR